MARRQGQECAVSSAAALALPVRGWSVTKRSQQTAEVLFLFVFVFNKSFLYPLAFRMKKQPAIPARYAGAAPEGLLHSAGSATAHLYRCVNTSALYLTGVPISV